MNKNKGFSLIELSALMTIISIIVAGYVYIGSASLNEMANKGDQTYKKMTEIDQAIKNFVQKYNRLPCPAKSTIPVGSISTETYNTLSYNFSYDSEYMANTSSTSFANGAECISRLGAVPTKALNLPDTYMLDAWGNKIIYQVSPALCGNNSATVKYCNSSSYHKNTADLSVYIISPSNSNTQINNVAYAIISSGANQNGACTSAGQFVNISALTSESSNSANKLDTATILYKNYLNQNTDHFDDIVIYATKNQIIANMYLPSNPFVTLTTCQQNTSWMNSMNSTNLNDLRNNLTILSKGDAAMLDMMWVLQEACYEIYGASISRNCPVSGTYNSTNNVCSY